MKFQLLGILLFIITGCAFHQAPHLAYSDSTIPLKNTSVLVAWAWDNTDASAVVGVDETDNKSMNCFNACPVWVRVPAGTHSFKIKHIQNFRRVAGMTVYDRSDIPISIENMQARHTYLVKYRDEDAGVTAFIEDLGENANYGMRICGMYGDCKTRYRAKFD